MVVNVKYQSVSRQVDVRAKKGRLQQFSPGATTELECLVYKRHSSQTLAIKPLLIADGTNELFNPYLALMKSKYPIVSV